MEVPLGTRLGSCLLSTFFSVGFWSHWNGGMRHSDRIAHPSTYSFTYHHFCSILHKSNFQLSIHLSIHPSIYPSTHHYSCSTLQTSNLYLSTQISTHPRIHPSVHLSIHPPIHPHTHPPPIPMSMQLCRNLTMASVLLVL